MRYFLLFFGLFCALHLFNSQGMRSPSSCSRSLEEREFFSTDYTCQPFSGVDKQSNNVPLFFRDICCPDQKKPDTRPTGFKIYHFFVPENSLINREYFLNLNLNLFLIYQFSLSLWKVLRL